MDLDYRSRNRESQRRARARRQAHVQELNQKIYDYEKREVQATQWMQAAARRVAQENNFLRNIIEERGVSK